MTKKLVRYSVVDAFTDTAFKGNPAAVCWLEGVDKDDKWLQSVAAEFNISETCYLTPVADHESENPRFGLRWFTPVAEVELCGHATLAASHFLYESGLVNSDTIEFSTLSGILTAKKVPDSKIKDSSNGDTQDSFYIELNFPVVPVSDYSDLKVSAISEILNGVSVIDVKKNGSDDLFVVLPSAKDIVEFNPQINKIKDAPGRGIIITALAPEGSGFDFYSRFFCPKYGIDEDPVCGSAHCALAAYWHEKLGKSDFVAYQASPRSGTVHVHLDKMNQRVLLRGKATTVMEGSLLVDAFTDTAFKGNPAAVCLLENVQKDDEWLQSIAAEFNMPMTCYLTPVIDGVVNENPRFHLRWFTPLVELGLCGHATLAASHFLFKSGLVNSDTIEFSTLSGTLSAKRVPESKTRHSSNGVMQNSFCVELNFPVVPLYDFNDVTVSAVSDILNCVSVVDVKKTAFDDILVVFPSAKEVVEFAPQFNRIKKAPGRGIMITALGPNGSGFDCYSRMFGPKVGVDEDPVCGSAHCAIAGYWHEKLGKCDFVAYQASPRSGILHIHFDEKNNTVLLRGKATTVMEGSLLV